MKKKKRYIFLVLLIVIGGAFWYWKSHQTVTPVFETVQKGTVTETVSLTGTLEPRQYADLAFAGSGRVKTILVAEGASVTKGQLLMTLENPVAQSQYQEANLSARITEGEEKLARRHWNDLKPEARQNQKLASELARLKKNTVAAQFVSDQVRAPFDGVVTRLDARLGEVFGPSTVALRVIGTGEFVIRTSVGESDVAKLQEGMAATITFDALLGGKVFAGELETLGQSALQNQDTVFYKGIFGINQQDQALRDGMTADIEVVTERRQDVLILPVRALKRANEGQYTAQVMIVAADPTETQTEDREVRTGLQGDDGTVEVLSGLREGDRVVVEAISATKK
jgi:RND family efflux transporter MFP subunit